MLHPSTKIITQMRCLAQNIVQIHHCSKFNHCYHFGNPLEVHVPKQKTSLVSWSSQIMNRSVTRSTSWPPNLFWTNMDIEHHHFCQGKSSTNGPSQGLVGLSDGRDLQRGQFSPPRFLKPPKMVPRSSLSIQIFVHGLMHGIQLFARHLGIHTSPKGGDWWTQ